MKVTQEVYDAIQILAKSDYNILDKVRSVLHSATIKKGYHQQGMVEDVFSKNKSVTVNIADYKINFDLIQVPQNYSQKDGYTVDNYVEFEDEIFLIDPKGPAHNNNTPISDTCMKWVLAKKQIEKKNPTKKVRFILLKPKDTDEYEFKRLREKYQSYDVELWYIDDFLSHYSDEELNFSEILKEVKLSLMRESMDSTFTI